MPGRVAVKRRAKTGSSDDRQLLESRLESLAGPTGHVSSSRCMEPARHRLERRNLRNLFWTTLRWLRRSTVWWSQTGSNRRPHACKARALPTELWPLFQQREQSRANLASSSASHSLLRLRAWKRLVGLGGLEPPTSRLSSARSNQLSYKPEPWRMLSRTRKRRSICPVGLVLEERETKAAEIVPQNRPDWP